MSSAVVDSTRAKSSPATAIWRVATSWVTLSLVITAIAAPTLTAARQNSQKTPLDPIEQYLGAPLLVEFPEIDDLGSRLPVPQGWRSIQADADSVDALRQRLGVPEGTLAVIYVDRYGNALHRDKSSSRRRRVARGIREFDRAQREWVARFGEAWAVATSAADRGRRGKEVSALKSILDSGLVGYATVESARRRWQVLNDEVWQRLLEILAEEGIVSRKQLDGKLRDLAREAAGLPVAANVQREVRRLKSGFGVRERRT